MDEMRHHGQTERKAPAGLAARGAVFLIRLYQFTLSSVMGRGCRFAPSCSSYLAEAIERHGAWSGLWLGLFRVARCHPWGGSGYDPVPEDISRHGIAFWRAGKSRRNGKGRE